MISWYPIASVPHVDQVVLFYVPGKLPTVERSSNWHYMRPNSSGGGGAHWLDGATHWSPMVLPEGTLP